MKRAAHQALGVGTGLVVYEQCLNFR
jgi:hypothetical protein